MAPSAGKEVSRANWPNGVWEVGVVGSGVVRPVGVGVVRPVGVGVVRPVGVADAPAVGIDVGVGRSVGSDVSRGDAVGLVITGAVGPQAKANRATRK
jgi:hypothetical protein